MFTYLSHQTPPDLENILKSSLPLFFPRFFPKIHPSILLVRKSRIRSYYSQISSLFNFYLLNRESLRQPDMSLVVIANTTSNQEQFGRFIDELKGIIASYNSSLESAEASGTKVDLNAFITKARTLLDQDNLSGLLSHILSLGSSLINDPKCMAPLYIRKILIYFSCCQHFLHFGFALQQDPR